MGKSLEGKVAIVTGSGQGIGQGIAIYLAREGASVITNNRKPGSGTVLHHNREDMPEEDWNDMLALASDAEGTAAKIKAEGGVASAFYGDISQWNTAKEMIEFTMATYGRIDILVNNAAGMGTGSVLTMDEKNWDTLTQVRLKGAMALTHFAVPHMIEQGFGRILNASSDAWTGLPDNDAYSVSTAGMVGLTWASAKELWRHGITVNCFCPQGASPAHVVEYRKMLRNVKAATGHEPDPNVLKVVEANHGDPINLGPIIAYLSTEDASYISGNVFAIYASGVVKLYSNPEFTSQITKNENAAMFTVDELKDKFHDLLGKDYKAPASARMW